MDAIFKISFLASLLGFFCNVALVSPSQNLRVPSLFLGFPPEVTLRPGKGFQLLLHLGRNNRIHLPAWFSKISTICSSQVRAPGNRGSHRVSRQWSEVLLLMLFLIEWSHFPASLCWAVTVGRAACFTSALPRAHVGGKGIQLVSFLWMQTAQSAAKSPEIHLRKQGDTKIMYSS